MFNEENLNKMLDNIFASKVNILKEMQTGLRCKTFLLEKNNIKYIFQIYEENTKYQAKKKYDILELFNDEKIPKAYFWGLIDKYSYLVTEYKEGEELTKILANPNFSLNEILYSLAKVLVNVHYVKNNFYGWITDIGIVEYDSFYEYIMSECNRLSKCLDGLDKNIRDSVLEKVRQSMNVIYSKKIEGSNLCWYDLNPDNILIKKSDISAIIDPGGARYGVKEWDLAFIKMEICRTEEEFKTFLTGYLQSSKQPVDEELISALTVMVEFDDIAIRINDKIRLPIPYVTNFRDEIEIIEKNL